MTKLGAHVAYGKIPCVECGAHLTFHKSGKCEPCRKITCARCLRRVVLNVGGSKFCQGCQTIMRRETKRLEDRG